MKGNKNLVVRIGAGELCIRLKAELRDERLPHQTVDLLVTVVLEAMLKDAKVAALLNEGVLMPSER